MSPPGRAASDILRGAAEREMKMSPIDDEAARQAGILPIRELKDRLRLFGVCDELIDACRERSELVALLMSSPGAMVDLVSPLGRPAAPP